MKYEKPQILDLSDEMLTEGADCKPGNQANLCNYGSQAGNPGQGNKNCQQGGSASVACTNGGGFVASCAGGSNPQ